MGSDRVLILDVHAVGKRSSLCATLQPILEPEFRLDVVVQSRQMTEEESAGFGAALNKRFKPGLIFVLFSHRLLKQTKALLESIKKSLPEIATILINESRDPTDVLELFKVGASDFITPPLQAADVLPRTWRLMKRAGYKQFEVQATKEQPRNRDLIGRSPCFLEHVERIPLLARCEANVLIGGETGTGKELYARAIHYCGPRASRPFTPVTPTFSAFDGKKTSDKCVQFKILTGRTTVPTIRIRRG